MNCTVCKQVIWWDGASGWWRHQGGGVDGHAAVPPPPTLLLEPLARALAVLTDEPVEAWRGRTLTWPDERVGYGTIHLGALVRWRLAVAPSAPGGAWVHTDSASVLRTTAPAEAWGLLADAGLVSGAPPPGLGSVREVLRVAAGCAPDEACQAPGARAAGGTRASGVTSGAASS